MEVREKEGKGMGGEERSRKRRKVEG